MSTYRTTFVSSKGQAVPATITQNNKRLYLSFPYHPQIKDEVKAMQDSRWDPETKQWHVLDSPRNKFALATLMNLNPYADYDIPLLDIKPKRKLMSHQVDMFRHFITRKQCIIAGEMGTGKTLAALEAIEYINDQTPTKAYWVGPKNSIPSIKLEIEKWKFSGTIEFYTYEGFKKLISQWKSGDVAPRLVVYDECHYLMNPTSQRTKAALYMTECQIKEHKQDFYIFMMSGTPAPKDPCNWWSQCEIAKPGFIKEGDQYKLKRRLCIIENRESISGGSYPHLIAWKDNELKCDKCGKLQHEHVIADHTFIKSINEISKLYKRMNGLVLVKFKKDCIELPDKIYRVVKLEPSTQELRQLQLLKSMSRSGMEYLNYARQLSDGFQYKAMPTGEKEVCSTCNQTGVVQYEDSVEKDEEGNALFSNEDSVCPICNGSGMTDKMHTEVLEVGSKKDDAFKDILDEHDYIGRLVVYCGFTGSIDRCIKIIESKGWDYIRVDGRGWHSSLGKHSNVEYSDVEYSNVEYSNEDLLRMFQNNDNDNKIVFIGHPKAAGTGLTLTASPSIVYFSNDFDTAARLQSEDRIHRVGMDVNRGATIIDLIYFPTDQVVLDALKRKKRLQDLTLGKIEDMIKQAQETSNGI